MSDRQMNGDRMTVRLPAELRRRLKEAAHHAGMGESEYVRAAVERQLALEDDAVTAYGRARRDGVMGVVWGVSRDVSTHPRHFDGFGGS